MDWRNDPYWKYGTFSLNEPSGSFDVFADVVSMWRGNATAERIAPDWSDISLDDLKGWWGWTYVYDLHHPSDADFRIRLWGSKVANALGYDITGKVIRCVDAAEAAALLPVSIGPSDGFALAEFAFPHFECEYDSAQNGLVDVELSLAATFWAYEN